jgi:hypothetical protein
MTELASWSTAAVDCAPVEPAVEDVLLELLPQALREAHATSSTTSGAVALATLSKVIG